MFNRRLGMKKLISIQNDINLPHPKLTNKKTDYLDLFVVILAFCDLKL